MIDLNSKSNRTRVLPGFLRTMFVAVALLVGVLSAQAQVSVTATAGTPGPTPYANLSSAFASINGGVHQGAITVSISASFTDVAVSLLNSSGSGLASYTSVLVRPVSDGVVMSYPSAQGFGVIELNGADNVTIDGDNPNTGGIARNLTITNTAANTINYTSVIRIAVLATTQTTADGNIIRNCILNGSATSRNVAGLTSTTAPENTTFGILASGNGGASATTAVTSVTGTAPSGTTINNLIVSNNAIDACARGIAFIGAVATVSPGLLTITNNVIGAAGTLVPANFPFTTPTTTVYTQGIYVGGVTACTISDNSIRNILSYVGTTMVGINMATSMGAGTKTIENNTINGLANNGTSGCFAISMASNTGGTYSISRNTINNVQNNASASCAGISITSSTATSGLVERNKISSIYARSTGGYAARGIILGSGNNITAQNNMIWDLNAAPNNSTTGTTFGARGIGVNAGTGHKLLHNSISLSGQMFVSTGTDVTTCISVASTAYTGMEIRNNILSNTMTATTGAVHTCLQIAAGGTSAMNLLLNNNAYYAGSGAQNYILTTTTGPATYTAANFVAGATTPATNSRAYTSVLNAAGTNDNASFAATTAAPFNSATDLHVLPGNPGAGAVNGTGADAGVLIDHDGDYRPSPPSIGADELNPLPSCTGTPTAGAITGNTSYCTGGPGVTLTLSGATGGAGITYQWRSGTTQGGPYPNTLGTATTQNTGVLATTTYYQVEVNCAGFGSAFTNEFTVSVTTTPSATAGLSGTACTGNPLNLTGSSPTGTSYSWTGPAAFASTVQNPLVTATATTANSGTYSLTASLNGCPSPVSTVAVTVNVGPSLSQATATPAQICFNANSQLNVVGSIAGYTQSTPAFVTETCGATAGPSGDDAVIAAPGATIGFPFTYFGITYNNFTISTNGNVQLGNGSGAANNPAYSTAWTDVAIPNPAVPNNMIALGWDDWNANAGQITYGVTGTAPNRKMVICFINITGRGDGSPGCTLDGQIVLEETTNAIQLNMTNVTSTVAMTQGLEDQTGSAASTIVAGRNNVIWSALAESRRFVAAQPTYSWSPASFLNNTTIANPLASNVTATTTYTVTATAPNACTSTSTATVTVAPPISAVTITPSSPAYCSGSSVTLTATPVNGGGPFLYQWTDPNLALAGTIATQAANIPGTWSVTINDNCGAQASGNISVTENQTPTAVASVGPTCLGQTVNFTGTTTASTYTWSGPNGFSSTLQNPSIPTLTTAGAGTYTFTASTATCSAQGTVAVTAGTAPTFSSITGTPNPICAGANSQLNAVAGVTLPNVLISEVTLFRAGTGQTASYPAAYPGADLVELVNASTVAADVSGWTIGDYASNAAATTHPLLTFPAATIIPPNSVLVVQLGTGTNDPTNRYYNTGGTSDQWGSGSLVGIVLKDGSTIVDAVGLNTGYVFNAATGVTASNWSGTASSPGGFAGTIRSAANDSNTGADWIQANSPSPLQTIGTYNAYNNPNTGTVTGYAWSPATYLSSTTIANPMANAVAGTITYTVTATSNSGCVSAPGNVTLTVNPGISAVNITPASPRFCSGLSVTLTATPVDGGGPFSYSWTDPNSAPAGTNSTVVATIGGLWTVDVSDACGGPAVQGQITVIEDATPSAAPIAGPGCVGQTLSFTGQTSAGPGALYSWIGPNTFTSGQQNPTIPAITNAAAGTYSFTVTSAAPANCVSATGTVIVSVNTPPTITAAADVTPNPICAGGSAQLSVTATAPGYSVAQTAFAPVTGSGTAGPNGDDVVTAAIPIGFNFPYFGATETDAFISTNGFIMLGTNGGSGCCTGQVLPNAGAPNNVIALAWEDLNAAAGQITYFNLTAPNRFVVNFNGVPNLNGTGTPINGQIILYQTGVIEMHITSFASGPGDFYTQGIENSTGTLATVVPSRNSTVWSATNEAYRFSPNAPSYLWDNAGLLNNATLANPIASNVLGNTTFTVTATNAGCSVQSPVLLSVDPPPTATVTPQLNCGANQFSLDVNITSTGTGTTAGLSWTVNGSAGAGSPMTGLSTGITTLGPFVSTDEVAVTILHQNTAICNRPLGTFYSNCPIVINCGNATAGSLCYRNSQVRSYLYASPYPGETVTISFTQGSIGLQDAVNIYNGPNNLAVALGGGNFGGNIGGNFFTTTQDSLFVQVVSNDTTSCFDGAFTQQLEWFVQCTPGCTQPDAFVDPILDCANGTFQLDVTPFDAGDGSTGDVNIYYEVGAAPADTIFNAGLFTSNLVGPYPLGTTVNITIGHADSTSCNKVLAPITIPLSACPNDEPCQARNLTMNPNYTCTTTSPGNFSTTTSTLSNVIGGPCTGLVADLWYKFVATATTHRIQVGGTFGGKTHSLWTGSPDCTNLVPVGATCTTVNNFSNPTGLNIGQTYYVRVGNSTVSNHPITVCVSAPPLLDMRATALFAPAVGVCFGAAETVSITVQNTSLYAINFATNPVTVTTNVTGPVTVTLNGTVNTGTLAAGASQNVPMSTTLNMSAGGIYTFNAFTTLTGDGNPSNNAMTAATRTVVAPVALPQTCDFTGFTGANLTAVFPNWREAVGATLPAGTTSLWAQSGAAAQTQLGTGVSARINLFFNNRNEWIVGPKIAPVVGTQLQYKIAITTFVGGGAHALGMQTTDDRVRVMISTDCGLTYNTLFTHNAATTVGLTNIWQQRVIDLSAYAGQQVILGFLAQDGPIDDAPDYDFHIDDINILNVAVCTGPPTAGTATVTPAGPFCAPASATLSMTGQSNAGGTSIQWYTGSTPTGPYTAIPGATTASASLSGVPVGTYYVVASVKCTLTNDSTLSNQLTVVVNPTPTATPTNNGPICAGNALNFTGASNGASFAWSGPNGFSSTLQNPSIATATTAASGTYTFTATLGTCSSAPTTTVATVNPNPTITSATATPTTVCAGTGTSQLNVVSPAPGYTHATATFSVEPCQATAGPSGDDAVIAAPGALIGFPFTYFGITYNNFTISTNGNVQLGDGSGSANNPAYSTAWTETAIPNAAIPNNMIALAWDDWNTSAGQITYGVTGTAPNRKLVVCFTNITGRGDGGTGTLNAQVVLEEGSNRILMNQTAISSSSFKVQGLEDATGSAISLAISGRNNDVNWSSANETRVFTPNSNNFLWTPGTNLTGGNTIANPVFGPAGAGVYNYIVRSTNGTTGCFSEAPVTVTANPALSAGQANITPAVASICGAAPVILTANPTGGGGPYQYAWTDPNAQAAGTNQTQSAAIAGTWSVLITDACSGQATATKNVAVFPVPTASASAGPGCVGNDLQLNGTTNGVTFAWSGPNSFTSTLQNPVIPMATTAATGTYTFTASANGCASTPATVAVTINQLPVINSVTATPSTLCAGNNSQLNVTTPGPSAYCNPTYSTGCTFPDYISNVTFAGINRTSTCDGNVATGVSYFTTPSATVMAGTSYPISISTDGDTEGIAVWIDYNKNGVFDAAEMVFSGAPTAPPATFTGNVTIPLSALNGTTRMRVVDTYNATPTNPCVIATWGETEDYNITISGGASAFTYAWSPATFLSSTTIQNPVANMINATTTYTVSITANTGCSASGNVTVNVTPLPVVSAGSYGPACGLNAADIPLAGTPTGGTFSGTGVGGPLGNQVFDPSVGTQTITYQYFDGTCIGSDMTTITVLTADGDGDGIPDCADNCPTVFGQQGDFCDSDPGPGVAPGALDATCSCAAIPCTENISVDLRTDVNSNQASFEIFVEGSTLVYCNGGINPAFPSGITTPIVLNCCLPAGCYKLVVYDSGGDGFVSGGYQVRESGAAGRRIVDNFGNFSSGSSSSIAGPQSFCLPIGDIDLIWSNCDKLDWVPYKYLVCHADAAVSAQWVVNGANNVQPANSGYEFWIFDPNGTYSFRRFRSHNVSDGFSPASANRAAHMKIHSWYNTALTPHIPDGVLMNVRVRPRVNGANGAFGPTCKMMMDAARAACPQVWLQDDPANPSDFSCGVTRTWGGSNSAANKIVAKPPQFQPAPLAGGTSVRFQFRFRIPGEQVCITLPPQTSATRYLNWTSFFGAPLVCSKTYEVDVRVSKDGGATWCIDSPSPACYPAAVTEWGRMCTVTIGCPAVQGGPVQAMSIQNGSLTMYPNPNRGDQVYISLTEVASDVRTVSVDIYELSGKRVTARTIAVQDGYISTALDLNGSLAAGMYMVNITAGDKTYTERLVIQP